MLPTLAFVFCSSGSPYDGGLWPDNKGVQKINSAHALGGINLVKKTIRETFGIKIDKYISELLEIDSIKNSMPFRNFFELDEPHEQKPGNRASKSKILIEKLILEVNNYGTESCRLN